MTTDFSMYFAGRDPLAIKANDPRVLVNGLPLPVDFRIVSEGNYQSMMSIVRATGKKVDENAR